MSYTTNFKFKKDGTNYSDLGLAFCDLANDQTISGTKTFSNVPVVGTRDLADSGPSAASTAFVKGQGYAYASSLSSYATTTNLNSYALASSLSSYATTTSLGSYARLDGAVFTGAVGFNGVVSLNGAPIEIYDAANAFIDFKNNPSVDNHARIILNDSGTLRIQSNKNLTLYSSTAIVLDQDTTCAKFNIANGGGYIKGANGNAIEYSSTTASAGGNHVFFTDSLERFRVHNGGAGTIYSFEAGVITITGYGDTGDFYVPSYRPYTSNGDQGNTPALGKNTRYCLWAKGYGGSRVLVGTEVDVYSDIRIKENIDCLDTTYALNSIRKLKPVSYNYIENNGTTEIGFIAQETEKYIPESVKIIQESIPNILSHGNVTKIDDETYEILLDKNFNSTTIFYFPVGVRIVCGEQTNDDYSLFEIKIVDEKQCLIVKRNKPDSLKLDGQVFVKGIFVNDFRVLAKNVVFTYAVSALQQVDIEVQQLKNDNESLRREIQTMNTELNELKELVKSIINK